MVVASKVASSLNLQQGYRIVNNCGKNGHQTVYNLYVEVIGGQQLTWPPFNRPVEKEEEAKGGAQGSSVQN